MIAGATYREGVAYNADGALYVVPTGSASITGGTITGITSLSLAEGAITMGRYTPTLTPTVNVTGATAYSCHYLRIGNEVSVFGTCDIDPTAINIASSIQITLPIASDIVTVRDVSGTGMSGGVFGLGGYIAGNTTNNTALLTFMADGAAANNAWGFSFAYQIQ